MTMTNTNLQNNKLNNIKLDFKDSKYATGKGKNLLLGYG